ncbi:MAG: PilZ domain-containing protein [Sphingomicrobium sp.]
MQSNQPHRDSPQEDKRADDRFDAAMSVRIDDGFGWTRDVSASGIYFESEAASEVGSIINLVLEVVISGDKHRLVSEGKVVRIDKLPGGNFGVAARLRALFFADAVGEPGDSVAAVPAALDERP